MKLFSLSLPHSLTLALFFLSNPDMGGKCTTCLSLSGPARREGAGRAGATIIRFSPRAAAHSQNADWTRPPALARPPAAPRSPARPGSLDSARGSGGTGCRHSLARSLAARSCSFPSCLRSPCQPAFLCLFSRLKGALRRWKTSLTSRQKREKGLGSKVVLLGLPRWYGAGGEGKRLARPAEQKHHLSPELCNFSQPWPLRLDFRPSA